MSTSAREWVNDFARELGLDAPSDDETAAILALAGSAARSSERIAAPVACWLAARAGLSASEALGVAQRMVVPDPEAE